MRAGSICRFSASVPMGTSPSTSPAPRSAVARGCCCDPDAGVPPWRARAGAGAGVPGGRRVLGPCHLLHRGRMGRRWARPAGCSGSARSSTGPTRAMAASTISSARWRRASARRCGANGATCRRRGFALRTPARRRDHAAPLGGLPPLLPQHHRQEVGPQRLSDQALLAAAGRTRWATRVVLMVAERDGEPVAGALNLLGRDALYGRNWGAMVDAPFLHFELLLLPRHRLRDRARHAARRGRRAGRAQDPARLPAGADLLRALDRASRAARARSATSWIASARRCGARWRRWRRSRPSARTARGSASRSPVAFARIMGAALRVAASGPADAARQPPARR